MNTVTNSIAYSPCFNGANKKEKKVGGFGPFMASTTASGAITLIPSFLSLSLTKKMQQAGNMKEEQIKSFHDAAEKMLKEKGLADKVKIHYHPETTKAVYSTSDILAELLNPMEQVKHGYNAFFCPKDYKAMNILTQKKELIAKANTIHMPEKSIAYSVLHEVGHSINYNSSKIGKLLQKIRPVSMYAPAALALYASLTRKSKPDENGNYTKKQKANNFIRDNAGKLSLIATLPMLAEEGLATMRGKNFAKKFLSPDLVKKYTKGTRTAYLSYLSVAVFGALAAYTATKVKDKKIAQKEAKLQYV